MKLMPEYNPDSWKMLFGQHRAALLLCVGGFLVYFFLVVYRYYHFAYTDWDLSFYIQSHWNLLQGRLYSSLFAFNHLGDHANFITFFTLPVFMIFPHPLTLMFIQVILFILSAWLIYYIAQEELGKSLGVLIGFLYLIFPPNILAICHDYNVESLAPFFFLLVFFFYKKKQIGLFYLSALLLILIKENMPLIIAMFGILGLLSRDRNRICWGVLPFIFSLVYFIIAVRWVIPYFHETESMSLWVRYNYLGKTIPEIFFNLLRWQTWKAVLSWPENIHYITTLFGVFLIPVVLSPSIILLVLPIVGYHLLSTSIPEKTIYYYYALPITPAIFLATVYTLKKISHLKILTVLACAILAVGCLLQFYQEREAIAYKVGFSRTGDIDGQWRLVGKIPPTASVIATFGFLPALSLRENLYSFHKVFSREYQDPEVMKFSPFYSPTPFQVPDNLEYAIIDYSDIWLQDALKRDRSYTTEKVGRFLNNWREIDAAGTVKLYQRKAPKS